MEFSFLILGIVLLILVIKYWTNVVKIWKSIGSVFKVELPKCHVCGKDTELESVCEICDQFYCDDCSATFTIHNQIDFNCCEICESDRKSYE